MDQLLRALTLYDVTAYLLPGLIVVWAAIRAYAFIRKNAPVAWSWKLVVGAYIIGQLLQVPMSDEREWRKCLFTPIHSESLQDVFSKNEQPALGQKLNSTIEKAFKVANPTPKESFLLCAAYVQSRNLDSFVEIMHARYGFFRGLLLSFAFAALALAAAVIHRRIYGWSNQYRREWWENVGLVVLCLLGASLSYVRSNDFNRYYAEGIYRTFYVDWNEKHPGP
jgi:hypothetical protein